MRTERKMVFARNTEESAACNEMYRRVRETIGEAQAKLRAITEDPMFDILDDTTYTDDLGQTCNRVTTRVLEIARSDFTKIDGAFYLFLRDWEPDHGHMVPESLPGDNILPQ